MCPSIDTTTPDACDQLPVPGDRQGLQGRQ